MIKQLSLLLLMLQSICVFPAFAMEDGADYKHWLFRIRAIDIVPADGGTQP